LLCGADFHFCGAAIWKYGLPQLDDNGGNMAFIGGLIKRMVPDAASSEDGAGEHTKQMSIVAMQLI
jgi:hypothetical protein